MHQALGSPTREPCERWDPKAEARSPKPEAGNRASLESGIRNPPSGIQNPPLGTPAIGFDTLESPLWFAAVH